MKKDYPPEALFEGARLKCQFCGLELILKGCMWNSIQKEKQRLEAQREHQEQDPVTPS